MVQTKQTTYKERVALYNKCSKEELVSMLTERFKSYSHDELVDMIAIGDIGYVPDACDPSEYDMLFRPTPCMQIVSGSFAYRNGLYSPPFV